MKPQDKKTGWMTSEERETAHHVFKEEKNAEEQISENEDWFGYEEWQKRDLNGYFEIKEKFEDFKKSLLDSINNGVVSKMIDEAKELNNYDNFDLSVESKKEKDGGVTFSCDDHRYNESEFLKINFKDDAIEIYTDHYDHNCEYDDFVRIQPALNGNTAVSGNPHNFIDQSGDFSHRILAVGVRGLMTYDESKPIDSELKAKLLEGEKNKISSVQKYEIEKAKDRLRERLWRNQQLTPEIRAGMDKATPIKEVPADAPFKVTSKKRDGMCK